MSTTPLYGPERQPLNLERDVFPILQAWCDNPRLLSRRRARFERDDVPSYCSSTEHETDPNGYDLYIDDIVAKLAAPLSDDELDIVGREAVGAYATGRRLQVEFNHEMDGLSALAINYKDMELSDRLQNRVTLPRLPILVGSALRRRWESLGVWNPAWPALHLDWADVPVDSLPWHRPSWHDNNQLTWAWEEEEGDRANEDRTHPAWRAALARAGMRRGDLSVPPVYNPSEGDKAAFITSRPWFQYSLSVLEEVERIYRLSPRELRRAFSAGLLEEGGRGADGTIYGLWHDNGLWKSGWDAMGPVVLPGWKWPHESPSPEPEDYRQFETGLLSAAERDEYDRLEPAGKQPDGHGDNPRKRKVQRKHCRGLFAPPSPSTSPSSVASAEEEGGAPPTPLNSTPPPAPLCRVARPRLTSVNAALISPRLRRSSRLAVLNQTRKIAPSGTGAALERRSPRIAALHAAAIAQGRTKPAKRRRRT